METHQATFGRMAEDVVERGDRNRRQTHRITAMSSFKKGLPPQYLTPHERLHEVAWILAQGFLRLLNRTSEQPVNPLPRENLTSPAGRAFIVSNLKQRG